MEKALFAYLVLAILGTSLLVVTSRDAVKAVLWALVMFLHQAVLFLTLQAEFLAAIQVLVYAGAVLVLFLFVVYMINLREEVRFPRFVGTSPWAFLVVFFLLVLSGAALSGFRVASSKGILTPAALLSRGHVRILGEHLFREYILAFEVAGVLLLVAVLGAVVLVRRLREVER